MNNDIQSLLLNSLAAGGNGSQVVLQQLLSQSDNNDPTTQLLMNYLSQRQHAVEDDHHQEDLIEAEREHSRQLTEALSQLRERVESMFAELELLRYRNDMLSAAIGACNLCLGEDATCEVCGGTGQPGAYIPDQALFAEYVVPAIRAMQAAMTPPRRGGFVPREHRRPASPSDE